MAPNDIIKCHPGENIMPSLAERVAALERHCNACLALTKRGMRPNMPSEIREAIMSLQPLVGGMTPEQIDQWIDANKPAAHEATEDATVGAMATAIADASMPNGCDIAAVALHNHIAARCARNVLSEIKAGKVPGIYSAEQVKAEQQAMYAAGTRDGAACSANSEELRQVRAERDALKAQLEQEKHICAMYKLENQEIADDSDWAARVEELKAKLAEANASLELQMKSNERARKRYDAAHPHEAGRWPDRTDMVSWLMDTCDAARAELEKCKARLKEARWLLDDIEAPAVDLGDRVAIDYELKDRIKAFLAAKDAP